MNEYSPKELECMLVGMKLLKLLQDNLQIKKFWQKQGKTEYDEEIKFCELLLKQAMKRRSQEK